MFSSCTLKYLHFFSNFELSSSAKGKEKKRFCAILANAMTLKSLANEDAYFIQVVFVNEMVLKFYY